MQIVITSLKTGVRVSSTHMPFTTLYDDTSIRPASFYNHSCATLIQEQILFSNLIVTPTKGLHSRA